MGCISALFGIFVPRFALFVGWYNDPTFWNNVFSSQVWFVAGFLVLPWTTLVYGLSQVNGLSLINIIFIGLALVLDLATWGGGLFAGQKQVSNFRD